MLRASTWIGMTLAMGVAGMAVCSAQGLADDKSVDLQVWVIRATTKNKDISPELKGIADKLKQQFKYTGFKLERKAAGRADLGKTFTADLIGGYSLKLTPKKRDGKKIQLQVEVAKGKDPKLNATVTLPAGEFQLFGGWPLDGGDALIIGVSAR